MKLLIIRLSSIGDIVLTSPVIRCLKKQEIDSEIHFVTKECYKDVLKHNPNLHKLHMLGDDLHKTIEELKEEKFDFIIDLHKNLRSSAIKRALKVPSESFAKLNFQKYLMVNFKINFLPDKHIVDRYFHAVDLYGIKNDQKGLDYFISEEEEQSTMQLISKVGRPYIAIAIGATFSTKCYPTDMLIELCRKIPQPIILLGGHGDLDRGEQISLESGSHVHNLSGKLSLNESAAVVKNAQKVLTNDTGLMHIAAAYKKDTIVFWGNTIPEFGMYPYQTRHFNAEVKGLKCRPCSKLGYKKKCPKGHFKCMMEIDQKQVLDQLTS